MLRQKTLASCRYSFLVKPAVAILALWITFILVAGSWSAVSAQDAIPASEALHQGLVALDRNDLPPASHAEAQFWIPSAWVDAPNSDLGIELVFDGARAVVSDLPQEAGFDLLQAPLGNSLRWSGYSQAMTTYERNRERIPAPSVATSTAGHPDRDALVALYQATNGANWRNNDNWLSDAPLGAWYGVTTDDSGRVIELDLADNQLSGTIPSELGNLSNLVALGLWDNQLSGSIPSELGNLSNLVALGLQGNQLSGSIPSELGNLSNLMGLGLWDNQLRGSIPSELGNLSNLEVLFLSDNQLSGAIPSELGNLSNLTRLALSGNQLRGCVPEVWRHIEANDLDRLGLPFCVAPSPTPTAGHPDRDALVALYQATNGANWLNNDNWLSDAPLGAWHGVTTDDSGRVIELDLWGNQLRGSIPSELGNLSNLVWLILWGNQLSGAIPPELGNLSNLTDLDLWGNQLSGAIPSELGNLSNLTDLDLWGNQLSGAIPSELGNLSNLVALRLSDNQLSGAIPSELGNLSNLTKLYLSGNQLRGCVPEVWRHVETNDLDSLGLPFCVAPSPTPTATPETLTVATSTAGHPDRDALVALYQATNGANWRNNDNWLSDAPLGAWHGVTTDDSGRVIELDLSDNQLSGTIPSELGNLSNLTWLDLWGNQLSGTIPSELDNLSNLIGLSLLDNQLSGAIPSELGNLSNLVVLGLSGNKLSGAIPAELGNLSNLVALVLSDNQLSGTIPSELGNLSNLTRLALWGNQLSGTIPSELGNLSNLVTLGLSDNQLRGCVPEVWRHVEANDLDSLGLPFCVAPSPTSTAGHPDRDALVALYQATNGANWRNNDNWLSDAPLGAWHGVTTDDSGRVIELDLSDNQLSGSIPAELGNLSNLTELVLWDNQLSGSIPAELGNLSNLTELVLWDNQLSGSIPAELGNLSNLTELVLLDSQLSGSIPAELGNLSNLVWLVLSDNQLSGSIPAELGNLSNLVWLVLSDNQLSGSIPAELGNLSNLVWLHLSGNQLSGSIPSELGNLSNLTELDLSGNQLRGCVPEVWRHVETNDLDSLGLPFCVAPSPTPTATPEPLTSVQIFEKVSPAIAFIETVASTGSGVLVEGGYLVTNAHVVWPFDTARVVFPDGTVFDAAPVKGWDLLADLAVLGPIDAPAASLALIDGESIPIGADMYLIGYPGEFEVFPQPAIIRGLLSRTREWASVGITYFQTDATAIGGQSGGALVSETGDVIGISGFRITEGHFGFVASSADLLPRIRQLIAGKGPAGLGDVETTLAARRLRMQGGARRHELTVRNYWDDPAYVLNEPAGTEIEVALTGDNDGRVVVFDSSGEELLDLDDKFIGVEVDSFATERAGPHFLIIRQLAETPGEFTLTANRRLIQFDDPDRGGWIQVGQAVHGNIDFPGDIDHFLLHLEKNELIEIVAQSALADTFLTIDYLGAVAEQIVADDDSGGGLFDRDSRIVYRAPHTGIYFVVVRDAARSAPGGYIISVDPAEVRSTSSEFALAELRTAFAQLPTSYINISDHEMLESARPLLDFWIELLGLDNRFSHFVAFVNGAPNIDTFDMILAASGQISDTERAAFDLELLFSTSLDELTQLFLAGEDIDLHWIESLETSTVGDRSLGISWAYTSEGTRRQEKVILFRRGNLVAAVHTLADNTQNIVSAEQAARMLDAKLNDYLVTE